MLLKWPYPFFKSLDSQSPSLHKNLIWSPRNICYILSSRSPYSFWMFVFYPGLSIPFNYIHINIRRYKTITNDKYILSQVWCSNKFSYVNKLITFLTSCGGFLSLTALLYCSITYVTFIAAIVTHLRKFKHLLMKKWNLLCVWNLLLTTANN